MEKYIKFFIYLSSFSVSMATISQEVKISEDLNNIKEIQQSYLGITSGVSLSLFRDRATSPLFYQGYPLHFSLAYLDQSEKRYSRIQGTYAFGTFSPVGVQNSIESKVEIARIDYEELFQIKANQADSWNFKVGGRITTSANYRENKDLGNNGTGFEVISNLFASAKMTRFIQIKKLNRKSGFGYLLNVGIVNTAFRNKFVYTSHAPLLNKDNIYDDYKLYLFTGYRFNNELNYTLWFKNNNAVQLGYTWEIYSTRERSTSFQFASHTINFTLLYNLK